MLRHVLKRAPLPASSPVNATKSLSAAAAKQLAASGLAVSFITPEQLKDGTAAEVPLGFKARVAEVERTPHSGSRRMVAGLGERASVREYRRSVTAAVHKAKQLEAPGLTLTPPSSDIVSVTDIFHPAMPLAKDDLVEKTACFAVTAAYEYSRLKSAPAAKGKKSSSRTAAADKMKALFQLAINSNNMGKVASGRIIGSCVNDARNLGNLREDEGVPEFYVEWAKRFMLPSGIKLCKVMRGEQIREAGMNLLYSVGKGSIHAPYVMVLEYVGNPRSPHSTALVGKGVTFDCGGLNVKPYGSMETMHTDMMGASVSLCTLKAVAELELPINVVAAVGLVENAIGPDSFYPSSIIQSLKGTTVEILNTDAEGRLVLADLLTYVQCHAKLAKTPRTVIDLATLTGAIIVSLGSRRAGLFSNNGALSESLMSAGTFSGEELWPMPVGEEHMQLTRGNLSDLINCAPGRQGGSCTAAAFLAHFIEKDTKWAHLDIAGTSDNGGTPKAGELAGVSGYGVQLLVDYLRRRTPVARK